MNQSDFLSALAYLFLGQMVAFIVCQVLLLREDNRVQIGLWFVSNMLMAVSIVGSPKISTIFSTPSLVAVSPIASLVGGIAKFASLGYRTKSAVRDRWANALVLVAIAGVVLGPQPALLDYRLLITSIGSVAISVACIIAVIRNRYWTSQNEFGRSLLLIGMVISVVALTGRTFTSYPFGEDKFFLGSSETQVLGFGVLVIMSLFLQIGFTGLLVARQDKISKFYDRRNVRAWQRNALAAQRAQNLRKAGDDRLDFMELLTHEVRQPINNAQASLQSITPELDQLSTGSERATHALDRAKSSLDDITLALSNAIVAGTLSTGDSRWARQTVEAPDMLDMALLDCSASSRKHIIVKPPEDAIFIECVPILLRIALHNLFQYATGLADTHSSINVSVMVDDEHFGVAFMITGKMDKDKSIEPISEPDITMSDSEPSQMRHLAFFVADLIAKHHLGDCIINEDIFGNFQIKFFISQI